MSDPVNGQGMPNAVSRWVERWAPLIPKHGRVLDLACGNGVHRLDFETRVTDAAGMREQLVELAEMAKMAKSGNARR